MTRNLDPEKWLAEFKTFLATPSEPVPDSVTHQIFSRVHSDLNPAWAKILLKLAAIHLATAALTLSVCPQLGFSPFKGSLGLMTLFMVFGPAVCAAFCGAFFLGTSLFFVALVLKREELRRVFRHPLANAGLLGLLSLAGLWMLGGSVELREAVTWLAGAVVGGWAIFRLVGSLRLKGQSLAPSVR